MITLYGFGRVNERVIGLTRDLRVQWCLEETGLPYRVEGLDHPAGDLDSREFRRLNPFGQLPVIEDDGFILTETGAIMLYLAEKSGKLMPAELQGRAQVMRWCFAAVNTIEPVIMELGMIDLRGKDDPTGEQRRPGLIDTAQRWLRGLEAWLEDRSYLTGDEITVADLLMVTMFRQTRDNDLLSDYPRIRRLCERCESRPAWQRTLAAYEKRLGVKPGTADQH